MLPGKWKDWQVAEIIGSGSYGCVYRIEKDDAVMAVKVIEIPQEQERKLIMKEHGENAEAYCQSIAHDFETEIQTLSLLGDSKNIIKIMDYHVEKKKEIGFTIYIFMECLTSFPEYEISHKMDEAECIRLAQEIGGALADCQKNNVVHRDIKPENILVTEDGHFLLCDFGLARKLRYKEQISSVKGTYKYMAPEVYHGKDYTPSIDLYSLGLILYQCMNRGRGPFLPLDKQVIFFKDEEAALGKRMDGEPIPAPVDASLEFAGIIQKMIAFSPEDRYRNASELLKDLDLLQKGRYKVRKNGGIFRRYRGPILIACLAFLALAAYAAWYRFPVWKGEACGPTCWSGLNRGGTLTIHGKGAVEYPDSWESRRDQIKRIVIKEGITSIDGDGGLFEGCNNLTSVQCPASLASIGEYSFYNCASLKDVSLDANTKQYGYNAFQGTPWFEKNTDENGFLIHNHVLVSFSKEAEEPVIPESVTEIADFAFHDHDEIKRINLPSNVAYIGENAFSDCDNLETVRADNPAIEAGADAFAFTKWAEGKKWVTLNHTLIRYQGKEEVPVIPEGIETISPQVFADNPYIKELVIPEEVKRIGENAFAYSSQLESVKIKGPVETIPTSAFEGCASLEECILPDKVKTIQAEAFTSCVRLKKIQIPEGTKLLSRDGKDPFYQCDHIQIEYR